MRHSKNYRDGQRHLHPVPSSGAVSAAGDPFHAAGQQRHRHCPICFDTGETVLLAIGDALEDDVYIPWLCTRCHSSHKDKLSRFLSLCRLSWLSACCGSPVWRLLRLWRSA